MQCAAFPQREPPDEVGKENLSSLFHVAGRRRRPVVVAGPGQDKAGKTGPG